MPEPARGRLDLADARRARRATAASTPWSPRCRTCSAGSSASGSTARFFLDAIADARHARVRLPARVRHGDGPDARLRVHELGDGLRRPARGARSRARCAARRGCEGTAIVLCDAFAESGAPIEVSPRRILQRQLERLAERGLRPRRWAASSSSILLRDDYRAARAKGYRDLVPDAALRRGLPHPLEHARRGRDRRDPRARRRVGDRRSSSARASGGPGQHEINLRYAEALEMADRHVLYKLAAKEIAARAGRVAHVHGEVRRVARGQQPARAREPVDASRTSRRSRARARSRARPCTSSDAFRHFLGGLLAHAREVALLVRAQSELVQALPRRHVRADADRLELRQPHGGLPRGGRGRRRCASSAGSRAPTRIPISSTRRCSPRGSTGIENAIEPGPAFAGDAYAAADLPQVPTHAARGRARVRGERVRATRVRRRRDRPSAPLRAHRAAPGRTRA